MLERACGFDSHPGYHFLISLDDYKTAYYADNKELMCSNYGGVAQLARAFGSYPKGRGFDPLRRYHIWTRSSVG